MDAVAANVAAANPKSNSGWGARIDRFQNDFSMMTVFTPSGCC